MTEEKIVERETIAFSKGMKEGMIASLTNVMSFIKKDGLLIQTEVGKEIYNFCESRKKDLQKL